MPSGKRDSSKLRVVLGLVVCTGLLLAAVVIAYLTWRVTAYYTTVSKYATATAERENFLTASYGAEGRAVVENFETKWFTFESHKNPSIQSELATGPFLDYFGFVRRGQSIYDEPSWLDTKSATVTHVWVIEYSPERFKVVAHVTELIDEVTPKGDFIQSLPPRE